MKSRSFRATIALWLLCSGVASATPTFVQLKAASNLAVVTLTAPATIGNTVSCVANNTGAPPTSIVDSNSVALTIQENMPQGVFGNSIVLADYVVTATTSGSYTASASISRLVCYELSGVGAGIFAINNASSVANLVTTQTATVASDALIATSASNSASTVTGSLDNGTLTEDIAGAAKVYIGHVNATSTVTTNFTTAASAGSNYQAILADYPAAGTSANGSGAAPWIGALFRELLPV